MLDSFCVASEDGGKKGVVVSDETGGKCQKMCFHVLAVAERWEAIMKHPTSYTAALTHGLSKDVGKTPSIASEHKGVANVSRPFSNVTVDNHQEPQPCLYNEV